MKHGANYAYTKRGCRCGECRRFWSEYQRARRAQDPSWNTVYVARHKARKLGNPVEEPYKRADILERDGGICHLCKEPVGERFDLDHLIPLALGGPDADWNVAVAHPVCNSRRGSRPLALEPPATLEGRTER